MSIFEVEAVSIGELLTAAVTIRNENVGFTFVSFFISVKSRQVRVLTVIF